MFGSKERASRGPAGESSVITRTTESKPNWWDALVAQLTGRSTEPEVELDSPVSEEVPAVETELVEVVELEVTEPVVDQTISLEPELVEPEIDRHTPPEHDPDLIAAGRAWIGECVWSDLEPDYVAELTDDEVISGIARHYDGGVHAFEESGYDVVDAPLPFDVDENGFPTDHRTFQSHTLPDDTHSWLCGKEGCYNSAPDYATPDESLAAAHEHEISHGYDRELEVAAPVAVAELGEPEPDVEELDAAGVYTKFLEEVQGSTFIDDLNGPDSVMGGAVTIEDVEPAALDDGVTIEDAELDGQTGAVTIEDAELGHTEALDDGVCELPGSEPEVAEPEVAEPEVAEPEVAEPEPVLTETQQKAVAWVETLESGRVIQAHGVWEGRTILGQKTKCTVRAGADELGVEIRDMREIFGDDLVDDCLRWNDGERRSFDKIAKEIREDQGLEMER